jgi:hypothetical protein
MRCRAEFESASMTTCDIFCKSLVFGFVNADSFRYFDNLYGPRIKFISQYPRPMVIHCNRPDQIPWIFWGGIHDLSQILHHPGNDSNRVWRILINDQSQGPCSVQQPRILADASICSQPYACAQGLPSFFLRRLAISARAAH